MAANDTTRAADEVQRALYARLSGEERVALAARMSADVSSRRSAADVIISKLEWTKLGESDRQRRDVEGIIRAPHASSTSPTSTAGPPTSVSPTSGGPCMLRPVAD